MITKRIKNIITKTKQNNNKRIIEFQNVKIDLNKQIIFKNNSEYKINNTEKIILNEMISNPGKTFAREEIGKLIDLDKERSIDVIITRLRKKIEIENEWKNLIFAKYSKSVKIDKNDKMKKEGVIKKFKKLFD